MFSRRRKFYFYIVLLHRGALSLGDNRTRLGPSAFHWGILMAPLSLQGTEKSISCDCFDVTNGINLDPVTHRDLNPDEDWRFRRQIMRPNQESRLICLISLGTMAKGKAVPLDTIAEALRQVLLPKKDVEPRESCVSWTVEAVRRLHEMSLVVTYDMDELRMTGMKLGAETLDAMAQARVRDGFVVIQQANMGRPVNTCQDVQ